jgi:hypothetical protein
VTYFVRTFRADPGCTYGTVIDRTPYERHTEARTVYDREAWYVIAAASGDRWPAVKAKGINTMTRITKREHATLFDTP